MKEPIFLIYHLLTTLAKLLRPGGSRTIIAENLLLKQQLLIHRYDAYFTREFAGDEPYVDLFVK